MEKIMCLLAFTKITDKQNILFDEFFVGYETIKVIAFNYNGQGAALCRCDGELTTIDCQRIEKIVFGVQTMTLTNYLKSIFDPDFHSDEIHRTGDELIFRSPELTNMKRYDLLNLAKKTLKGVEDLNEETFCYFKEEKKGHCRHRHGKSHTTSGPLYGNVNSKVLHRPECQNFNPEVCTAEFAGVEEAIGAGYKPCGRCKPNA